MSLRYPIGLSLLILTSLSSPPAVLAEDQPADKKGDESLADYVVFAEVGVRVRQPKGYDKADDFVGFANADTSCSIMLTKIPAPFDEVSKGFAPEHMKPRGLIYRSKEELKIGQVPAVLVHFEQTQLFTVYGKWALVFGDAKRTIMVTATYPKADAKDLEPAIKAAVLSTQLDDSPAISAAEALPFTLTPSKKLVACEAQPRSLTYNRDGKIPATAPDDPMFIAAPSLGKGLILSRKGLAQRRIQQLPGLQDVKLQSTEEITIDGLKGFEVTATAVDQKTGGAMQVYEVILFEDGGYILALGLVGEKHAAEFLPEFKAMAESIRRKKPVEKPADEKATNK